MKVFIMRHGRSAANEDGRICGTTDVELTELGQEQAIHMRDKLPVEEFSAVYSSPLRRAMDTARLVMGKGAVIHEEPDLRERFMGEFEGLTWKELLRQFPDLTIGWTRYPLDFDPPGGETTQQLGQRVLPCFNRILAGIGMDEKILLVAHGCVINTILEEWTQGATSNYLLSNGDVVVLRESAGQRSISSMISCDIK